MTTSEVERTRQQRRNDEHTHTTGTGTTKQNEKPTTKRTTTIVEMTWVRGCVFTLVFEVWCFFAIYPVLSFL